MQVHFFFLHGVLPVATCSVADPDHISENLVTVLGYKWLNTLLRIRIRDRRDHGNYYFTCFVFTLTAWKISIRTAQRRHILKVQKLVYVPIYT
jgi:hypothetical protein